MADTKPTPRDFRIGVICAISEEGGAVYDMFDRPWGHLNHLRDEVGYTISCGGIGTQNVVLVWLGDAGKTLASRAATGLRMVFKKIEVVFVVGFCGGVPRTPDVVLGDVVISTAILEYDRGERIEDIFVPARSAISPGPELSSFMAYQQTNPPRQGLEKRVDEILQEMMSKSRNEALRYPGKNKDHLFKPDYPHKHYGKSCAGCNGNHSCAVARNECCADTGCDTRESVERRRLRPQEPPPKPALHFGTVASGDTVMESGTERDNMAKNYGIIAFEMESAGVLHNNWPILVIKSVTDYSDSHKNKDWQLYCAYAGAAAFKAFLEAWKSPSQGTAVSPEPGAAQPSSPTTPAQPGGPTPEPTDEESSRGGSISGRTLGDLEAERGLTGQAAVLDPEFVKACEDGNFDEMKRLIHAKSLDINRVIDDGRNDGKNDGMNLLHITIGANIPNPKKKTDIANRVDQLCRLGADVNFPAKNGSRPVHYCAMTMNREAVERMLNYELDVNGYDAEGRTALHCLAEDTEPDADLARFLIRHGGRLGKEPLLKVPKPNGRQREVRDLVKKLLIPQSSSLF